jgi:hypothetical protein
LITVFRLSGCQLNKAAQLPNRRNPIFGSLIGLGQLKVSLGFLRHQAHGAFKLLCTLCMFTKDPKTHSEQQPRGTVVRLESNRLPKTSDSLPVITTLLRDHTKVVIDQGMLNALLESFRENFLGGF